MVQEATNAALLNPNHPLGRAQFRLVCPIAKTKLSDLTQTKVGGNQLHFFRPVLISYLSVDTIFMREPMPFLLNSSSIVSLVCQRYLIQYLRPKLGPEKELEATANNLFNLQNANEGGIRLFCYLEMDVIFLGLKITKVSFWVTKIPNDLLDQNQNAKVSDVVG